MSEIKFNNLELRKDIREIVPNIDDLQLDLIEISVIHLVDVYVKAKFNQQQKEIERLQRVHVYECKDCGALFAVSQSFEEQHLIQCPVCLTDKSLHELSSGVLCKE
jgi:hypothetical protein